MAYVFSRQRNASRYRLARNRRKDLRVAHRAAWSTAADRTFRAPEHPFPDVLIQVALHTHAPVRQTAKFLSNQRENRYRNFAFGGLRPAMDVRRGHPERATSWRL